MPPARRGLDQSSHRGTHHLRRGASLYSNRLRSPTDVAPGYDDHYQGAVADGTRRYRSGEYDGLRTVGLCQRVQAVVITNNHSNTNERRLACWVRVLEGTVQHWTAAGADTHRTRYFGTPATGRLSIDVDEWTRVARARPTRPTPDRLRSAFR